MLATHAKLQRIRKDLVHERDVSIIMQQVKQDQGSFNEGKIERIAGLSEGCDVLDTLFKGIHGYPIPRAKKSLNALDQEQLKRFNKQEIKKAAQELSSDYILDVILPLLSQTSSEELRAMAARGEDVRTICDRQASIWQQCNNIWRGVPLSSNSQGINELKDAISQLFEPVHELKDSCAEGIEISMLGVRKMAFSGSDALQKNKLFFMLIGGTLALWPAYKSLECLWKAYKWWRGPESYEELMKTMTDLIRLFIQYGDAHPTEMDPEDVGAIHYLSHKLELEARKVPKQYRKSFMRDIRLMQAHNLSPRQKHHMIRDVIFNKYQFLKQSMMPEVA